MKTGWRRLKYTRLENLISIDEDSMDKEKFNLREIKNSMFKDSIGIFQGLIEFIEGLIARKKIYFWSQFRL